MLFLVWVLMIGEEWEDWKFSRAIKFYIYTVHFLLFHLSAPATFQMGPRLSQSGKLVVMGSDYITDEWKTTVT